MIKNDKNVFLAYVVLIFVLIGSLICVNKVSIQRESKYIYKIWKKIFIYVLGLFFGKFFFPGTIVKRHIST